MPLKIIFVTVAGLLMALAGCGTPPAPVFAPAAPGSYGVENHISLLPEQSPQVFRIRSQGKSYGALINDDTPASWRSIGMVKSARFRINLMAKAADAERFEAFFAMPVDDATWMPHKTRMAALNELLIGADAALAFIFADKAVNAFGNIYFAPYQTKVTTPWTDWQWGPLINPISLNLAMTMPPLVPDRERNANFDDAFFLISMLRGFSHEYAHVVNKNKPFQITTTPLGDEFTAHTIEFCIAFEITEFTDEQMNKQLLKRGEQFITDKNSILKDLPFATSTTGQQIAFTSLSALLSRPDVATRPRTEWTKLLRPYCKMVVDKNPGLETTEDGMDWIEKNVLLGKLNELVTVNSSAIPSTAPSTILSATPSAH